MTAIWSSFLQLRSRNIHGRHMKDQAGPLERLPATTLLIAMVSHVGVTPYPAVDGWWFASVRSYCKRDLLQDTVGVGVRNLCMQRMRWEMLTCMNYMEL